MAPCPLTCLAHPKGDNSIGLKQIAIKIEVVMNWEQKTVTVIAAVAITGYAVVDHFYRKSSELFLVECGSNIRSTLTEKERADLGWQTLINESCACRRETFELRNGKVRIALLTSGILGVKDYSPLTNGEHRQCLAEGLKNAKFAGPTPQIQDLLGEPES